MFPFWPNFLSIKVTFVGPNMSVFCSDSLDKSHKTMLGCKKRNVACTGIQCCVCFFRQWLRRCQQKKCIFFSTSFFAYYFASVFKDKNFFCLLMEGSGSRSVQKNNDDLDPGGPKTYKFYGSGSITLLVSLRYKTHDQYYLFTNPYSEPRTGHFWGQRIRGTGNYHVSSCKEVFGCLHFLSDKRILCALTLAADVPEEKIV